MDRIAGWLNYTRSLRPFDICGTLKIIFSFSIHSHVIRRCAIKIVAALCSFCSLLRRRVRHCFSRFRRGGRHGGRREGTCVSLSTTTKGSHAGRSLRSISTRGAYQPEEHTKGYQPERASQQDRPAVEECGRLSVDSSGRLSGDSSGRLLGKDFLWKDSNERPSMENLQ